MSRKCANRSQQFKVQALNEQLRIFVEYLNAVRASSKYINLFTITHTKRFTNTGSPHFILDIISNEYNDARIMGTSCQKLLS